MGVVDSETILGAVGGLITRRSGWPPAIEVSIRGAGDTQQLECGLVVPGADGVCDDRDRGC